MTPADQESFRPGFEAWYRKSQGFSETYVFGRFDTGNYISAHMIDSFEAWCAAKSEPVEITKDMVERATAEHKRINILPVSVPDPAERHYFRAILTAALSVQEGKS